MNKKDSWTRTHLTTPRHPAPPGGPSPRSQALLRNAFVEVPLPVGDTSMIRETELREVRSHAKLGNQVGAELGNEVQVGFGNEIRKPFASLLAASYNVPCPSQSNSPKSAFRNSRF